VQTAVRTRLNLAIGTFYLTTNDVPDEFVINISVIM